MPWTELNCTLVSDGSSDRALIPILRWLLHSHLPNRPVQLRWADIRQLPRPPKELPEKIVEGVRLFPCDLLFVHRDAESTPIEDRQTEIDGALNRAEVAATGVAVVPVRMMEAWLLIDMRAIREAADNPNGSVQLNLPALSDVEGIANPKNVLHSLILEATELSSRRKRKFNVHSAVHRIAEYIEDFSPLRRLSAFHALEQQVIAWISERGWGD